ncbi:Gfo/Idh/MocA family protein [Benzoatithermus flavus]|uniref:Gfo/Idh/MocA family oxidoreductase n=1 Tax=Benzoatithermus flavus TaxID=3108223 RepID=A0ABU8XS47_9PROT
MRKLRFGVLSTAKIAREKVIPPMQRASRCEVVAIASRDPERGREVAERLGIERVHGSYEALLADPDIDAVYNPLPNHLHVPWTIRAAEAGKHVLCEKPLGITTADVEELIAVRDRTGVTIQEAFMVRTHPQWLRAKALVRSGRIGVLKAIYGHFSYHLADPANIRNVMGWGGGGLLDIGCYPITTSRFVTDDEPRRVAAMIERDPDMEIDRLGSVMLDYPGVQCIFTYGTQLVARQTMQFIGTKARLEVEIPFNAPNDRPCRILIYDGAGLGGVVSETVELATCDQYGIMVDAFAASIQDGTPQPVPLEDSLLNMRVIDAVFRAAERGTWEEP